jgi:hypothetical protein
MGSVPHVERMIDKDDLPRLIVRTDFHECMLAGRRILFGQ